MPRWWKKAPVAATEADIRFLMLLCLGLEPSHPSDITSRLGQNPYALCKTLLRSAAFRRALLEPLILGKTPCMVSFNPDQQDCIRRGLKQHFRLNLPHTTHIDHWTAAITAAMESPRFLHALTGTDLVKPSGWIIDALSQASRQQSNLTGAIEDLSMTGITGYAYCPDKGDTPLTLDVYINDTHVGRCRADGIRRDIQEQFGGNGLCGFSLPFALPTPLADTSTLIVNIFDHESGQAIARAQEMARVGPGNIHYIPRLVQALETVNNSEGGHPAAILTLLEQIKESLPAIEQFSAIPLACYDAFFQMLRAPDPAQTSATQPTTAIVDPAALVLGEALPDADLYILVNQGWSLSETAVSWIQFAASKNPDADVFFADHDEVDSRGYHRNPFFRSQFDYEFLLARPDYAQAYAVRRSTLAVLGDPSALSSAATHCDIWLRLYEAKGSSGFCHVPQVLWHAAMPIDPVEPKAARNAVANHLVRSHGGKPHPHTDPHGGDQPDLIMVEWPIDPAPPKLAIIIPTRDQLEMTRACVKSLQNTLAHPEYTEIVIINNDSQDPEMLAWLETLKQTPGMRVLDHHGSFNWAEMNNRAARESDAPYLLFLNNDTLALEPGWDIRLRGQLNRPEVGAVGARLLFEDRTIQFAGYILHPEHIALKEEYGASPIGGGYQNRSQLPHATSALIGAFMGCRRDTFDALGGFDADRFAVAFNDIDFSLRISDQGLKNLYDPGMTFVHLESKSRGYDRQDPAKTAREQKERATMQTRHGERLRSDLHLPTVFVACEPTFSLLALPMPDPKPGRGSNT